MQWSPLPSLTSSRHRLCCLPHPTPLHLMRPRHHVHQERHATRINQARGIRLGSTLDLRGGGGGRGTSRRGGFRMFASGKCTRECQGGGRDVGGHVGVYERQMHA